MNFEQYLLVTSKQIRPILKELLSKQEREIESLNPVLRPSIQFFVEQMFGGKMLRGALVKLGYAISGKKVDKKILQVSSAFEILHSSLLVHDDIMDLSLTRRGKPSLYVKLGGNHLGKSLALCLGDFGFFLAVKLIAGSDLSADKKNHALVILSEIVNITILGQILDIEFSEMGNGITTEEELLIMQRSKTASYSFVGPLVIGALFGGATNPVQNNLKTFAENVGIAFQIHDDILGIFGKEDVIGKSVTSDIEEGKNTLLYYHALKKGSKADKSILKQYYGKGEIEVNGYKKIKKIFIETESLAYSQTKAQEYVHQAKKFIPKITSDSAVQSILHELAESSITRVR